MRMISSHDTVTTAPSNRLNVSCREAVRCLLLTTVVEEEKNIQGSAAASVLDGYALAAHPEVVPYAHAEQLDHHLQSEHRREDVVTDSLCAYVCVCGGYIHD